MTRPVGYITSRFANKNDSRNSLSPPVLSTDQLAKSFTLGHERIQVLDGVSLDVRPGELVVIMGPSGSGKTTLLNCVAGIETPDAGNVLLRGEPVDFSSERARIQIRRERIGVVFQFFNLLPTLTARENIELPFLIASEPLADYKQKVEQIVRLVGLEHRQGHYPHQLSGGEMQLVSIARALVREPELLLADEPTGNVNPRVGRAIVNTLREAAAKAGTSVLMVTHSPDHAAWADRICFLRDGVIADELAQGGRSDAVSPIHDKLVELGI